MLFDIDGTGEREYIASAYTMMIYEQEFGSSLIKDVYGKVQLVPDGVEVVTSAFVKERMEAALPEGKSLPKATETLIDKAFPAVATRVMDFTQDNWEAELRALWAMAKTADAAADKNTVPSYKAWAARLGPLNLSEVSAFVVEETRRGLFRTPHAEE